MPCTPGNLTNSACEQQTLAIDCNTGDLSISNGNIVNLGCAVSLLQSQTQITSFSLNGNILVLSYLGEDGVTQTNFVDLTPVIQQETGINFINTNSVDLTLLGSTLRADLNIDPAGTLPVSSSTSGVKFNCCPETPITANSTNTIQLVGGGLNNYTLTANLKYQSSSSIMFSTSSTGLLASLKYSTDAANAAMQGSDGAIYVQTAASQLAALPSNGFVTTGTSGTLLVGSDSKTYRIANPNAETPISSLNTNTANTTLSGASSHTIQVDVNLAQSNTVQLTSTVTGVRADVKIDTTAPGNVVITSNTNGLVANITETSIASIQNTPATVQNPLVNVFGTLNNGNGGYAAISASQYGFKFPAFTTIQRLAISSDDLYDTMFLFDTTLRAFVWYDAVNITWVQIS